MTVFQWTLIPLHWRHNGHDSVSNHQPHDCLLNRLFRRRSKKTSKLRVAGICAGNSPGTGEFPAQMASSAEFFSIWWRHHVLKRVWLGPYIVTEVTIRTYTLQSISWSQYQKSGKIFTGPTYKLLLSFMVMSYIGHESARHCELLEVDNGGWYQFKALIKPGC